MARACVGYATAAVSVVLILAGGALLFAGAFRTLIHSRLKKEITLTESSRVFNTWKNPPPPVYMEFFFFNVTNPQEFLGGAKPRVTHMGPYTYREYRPKDNVSFVDNGTKVSALTPKTFVFMPDLSAGDPSIDLITTVNIPAVAVMNKVKSLSFWTRSAMSLFMGKIGTGMFMTHTVDELLWGFKDRLLTHLHTFKPEVAEDFGLMLNKNGSHDGEFVYLTGEHNYLDYGRIYTWKGQKLMSFWSTNQSNMINGTDGSAFHPFLTKTERLDVFTADLCRSIYMLFEKEVEVKGIPAYRYTPPHEVLASPKNNPENKGFCLPQDQCLDDGVLNVATCRDGAPVIVSFPHFYLGDKKYVDAIEGITPVHDQHQTFLDLNPTTGIPVRASKRAQINIMLERITGFPMTKNMKGTIFPIMFLNESVLIDDASAEKLHKLLTIETLVSYFPFILVVLGVLLFIISILLLIRSRQRKTSTKEDTTYSPASTKADDEKNGAYVGLVPVEKS